ncbi:hypothetical protein RVR34_09535 [Microcystis aeruginosa FBCC-A68]|uniref:hypothetical protein n=1 Tax=Microcystis aeruginosa TaxID=1126 RepID=UPI003D6C24B8
MGCGGMGKWGNGEAGCGVWGVGCGVWGNGEVGEWGDHCVRVAGGSGEIELKPQNPKTPKPKTYLPTPDS